MHRILYVYKISTHLSKYQNAIPSFYSKTVFSLHERCTLCPNLSFMFHLVVLIPLVGRTIHPLNCLCSLAIRHIWVGVAFMLSLTSSSLYCLMVNCLWKLHSHPFLREMIVFSNLCLPWSSCILNSIQSLTVKELGGGFLLWLVGWSPVSSQQTWPGMSEEKNN